MATTKNQKPKNLRQQNLKATTKNTGLLYSREKNRNGSQREGRS